MGTFFVHEKIRQEKQAFFAQAYHCIGTIEDISPHPIKKWQRIYMVHLLSCDEEKSRLPYRVKITANTLKEAEVGDQIYFEKKSGVIKKELEEFDIFLAKEGLVEWLYLNEWEIDIQKQTQDTSFSFFTWGREQIYIVQRTLSEPARTLYGTIFLGMEKIAPADELKAIFNYWGITHYLARSGLHIALFIMLWKWIFYLLGFSFFMRTMLLLPILFLYIFFTPLSLSFLRGIWAFFLFLGAFYLYRPSHAQHMLYVSAFCILLYNPYALFFLDFQLSFSLTYVLFSVSSVINAIDEKRHKMG